MSSPFKGVAQLPVLLDAMGGDAIGGNAIGGNGVGGDSSPAITFKAASRACEEGLGPVTLVGDPSRLALPPRAQWPEGLELIEASQAIGMSEMPTHAMRAKPQSSMHVGMRALQEGKGCAFVTAGNSGAAVAVGLVTLKRVKGCERPAIASVMPSLKQPVVLLDMGANVSCKPKHLVQFGVMGACYAEHTLELSRPRVALLSNGHEASKGTDELRRAHQQLTQLDLNYIGYREAQALPLGEVDVLITDGFVGNVALKLSEGVVEALISRIKARLEERRLTRVLGAMLYPVLSGLKEELDWRSVGGAPILGLNETVLVCHGSSDADALVSAIKRARSYAALHLPAKLATALEATPQGGKVSTTSEILGPHHSPEPPAQRAEGFGDERP